MNQNSYYSPSQTQRGMESMNYMQAPQGSYHPPSSSGASTSQLPPPPLPSTSQPNKTYYPLPSNSSSAHISNLGIPNYYPAPSHIPYTSHPTNASPTSPSPSSAYINTTTPSTYPLEHWNELQYMVSIGNIYRVRELLNQGADAEWTSPVSF